VELRRAAWTNDPFVIAQNDNMVSVNTALQVDLTGQICSESLGSRQFSGTGGASDFAYGAFHSKGGRGIVALTSTAKGGTVSKIQPILTPGSIVSISRNIADYVVTEYGIAKLKDRTIRQRVENLIAVAHPDFRAELRKQADALMLW
jgi:acyl-CoA hydrolase